MLALDDRPRNTSYTANPIGTAEFGGRKDNLSRRTQFCNECLFFLRGTLRRPESDPAFGLNGVSPFFGSLGKSSPAAFAVVMVPIRRERLVDLALKDESPVVLKFLGEPLLLRVAVGWHRCLS